MRLGRDLFGVRFRNPVLLAAGTCGFGREIAGVLPPERLGGLVTKSVTLEPRHGNPAPRVAEVPGAMLNSVGLANPGAEAVRREKLPWMHDHLDSTVVWVSVAGHRPGEYPAVVDVLDDEPGFLGYELNLSCPNDTRLGGRPFALDPDAVTDVVGRVRARTRRPLLVKLAPNDPDPAATAVRAVEAGADGLTVVNTLPGLGLRAGVEPGADPGRHGAESERPILGAGPGGMSGPALRPVGLHAVWRIAAAVDAPVVGVGGILSGEDAWHYLAAGASLVQVGTGSFADPRCALRVIAGLERLGRRRGVASLDEVPRVAPPVAGPVAPGEGGGEAGEPSAEPEHSSGTANRSSMEAEESSTGAEELPAEAGRYSTEGKG